MSSDPFNMDGIHTADFQNSIQDLSSVITSSCVTPYDALLIRHVCTLSHGEFGSHIHLNTKPICCHLALSCRVMPLSRY